jgi:hypothetical protein
MLVGAGRTSSANGACGRHERSCQLPSLKKADAGGNERREKFDQRAVALIVIARPASGGHFGRRSWFSFARQEMIRASAHPSIELHHQPTVKDVQNALNQAKPTTGVN